MSTGTNKERLEQNNLILNEIKLTVDNLPEAGGGSGDVKLFETIDEMQADTDAKEGDLAIIYRKEIQNAQEGQTASSIILPQTVVLPSALETDVWISFGSGLLRISLDIMPESAGFNMNNMQEGKRINIEYTSTDGITYTTTSADAGQPIDLGTEITLESEFEEWNDAIGYFIQAGGSIFEGLFTYGDYDKKSVHPYDVSLSKIETIEVFPSIVRTALEKLCIELNASFINTLALFVSEDGRKIKTICRVVIQSSGSNYLNNFVVAKYNNNFYIIVDSNSGTLYNCEYNLATDTWTFLDLPTPITLGSYTNKVYPIEGLFIGELNNSTYTFTQTKIVAVYTSATSYTNVSVDFPTLHDNRYLPSPTQLTATHDYVWDKTFYGKNGVETGTLQNKDNLTKEQIKSKVELWDILNEGIKCPDDSSRLFEGSSISLIQLLDTSNVTNMDGMFMACHNLQTIPQLDTSNVTNMTSMFNSCYNLQVIPQLDTSNVTNMDSMFYSCTNLQAVPQLYTSNVTNMNVIFSACTNLTDIPLLDTSNVTKMSQMFSGCTNLTDIPLLDTSNVDNAYMYQMFSSCPNLSDASLNNILAMCKNAVKVTAASYKTLKRLGLSSTQATICTTLSNYQAFLDAGWTTGY